MKKPLTLFLFLTFVISCSDNTFKQTKAIENVFTTQNLPTQIFEVNTDKDTLITGKNGTKVGIPKNSFVDKNGNVIIGKISFELKEALTLIDMVLGNLTTTSNGKILQTGGMIYTNATLNGENILIAKNKTLQISVPSNNKNDSMLVFEGEVNPENKSINWINPKDIIEKNKPTVFSKTISRPIFDEHKNREIPLLEVPKKPIEYTDETERVLSINFENSTMFPELQQYKNVKFKVSEKSDFNLEDSKKTWYDVKLEKTNEEGIYKVTFEGVDKGKVITKEYLVSPAYQGSDYKKALAVYEEKFEQYEKKKMEIAKEKERLIKEQEKMAIKWQKEFDRQQKNNFQNIDNTIYNPHTKDLNLGYTFDLKQLGWYNIDALYSDIRTQSISLKVEIDNKPEEDRVYIAIIFKNKQISLPGYEKKDGSYGFSHNDAEPTNLPVGEEAIILATTYRNNIPYFAFQKIIIAQKQSIHLSLKETTKLKLEAYLRENI